MPPTATWQAAIHQTEDAASKYLMPLAASERRLATEATYWQLVWAAAGHMRRGSQACTLALVGKGAPGGPLRWFLRGVFSYDAVGCEQPLPARPRSSDGRAFSSHGSYPRMRCGVRRNPDSQLSPVAVRSWRNVSPQCTSGRLHTAWRGCEAFFSWRTAVFRTSHTSMSDFHVWSRRTNRGL